MATANDLTQLPNIGKTIARRLADVGIHSETELREAGAAEAFRQIEAAYPGATVPVCYYLYSLEGALTGTHWDSITEQRKRELLSAVGHPEKYRPRKN